MTNITDILKPCPFCGHHEYLARMTENKAPRINCGYCGSNFGFAIFGSNASKMTDELWNTRAPTQEAILGNKLAAAQTRWLQAHDALQDGLSSFDLHNDTVKEAEQSLENLRAALTEWNKLEGVK